MIAPLRARHRHASLLLGPLALAGIGLGLWARPKEPPAAETPHALPVTGLALRLGESLWELRWRESAGSHGGLELVAREPSSAPDLWLYVADRPAEAGESLPRGARCVGRAAAGAQASFLLDPPPGGPAWLYLYSLAWGEVVGAAQLVLPD